MLITRQLARILALALPLAVAAYSQAMVQYGAAITAGSAAGAAAGKQASDALTKVMNTAAVAGQTGNSAEVAAVEARIMAKPDEAKSPSEYKSVVKAANMPSGGAGPSPAARPASGKPGKKEAPLVASAAGNVPLLTGKPLARTRRGLNVAAVEPKIEEAEAPASIEVPLALQLELASFHPVLLPLEERMHRIVTGDSREVVRRILGAPASKVTIPADRDVTEIYYYQEKGRSLGTIRLEAGSVIAVRINSL